MHFSPGSSIFAPIALLLWHSAAAAPAPSAMMPTSGDLTVYVNPFIGTEGPVAQGALNSGASSGDTFPGVGLPFGVVKLGPDTNEPDQTTNPFAGYTPNGNGLCISRCLVFNLTGPYTNSICSYCFHLLP